MENSTNDSSKVDVEKDEQKVAGDVLPVVEDSSATSSTDYPPNVVKAIQQLFPSNDPLDSVEFDPVEYINQKFPTQQSMSHLDEVMAQIRKRISDLDNEISVILNSQSTSEQEGTEVLDDVKNVIDLLTSKIIEMKKQANQSQKMVTEITHDIKSLDSAKNNLTSSIVMLNNLHILVDAVDKMDQQIASRKYSVIAPNLSSCLEVLNQLSGHSSVPQIHELSVSIDELRKRLGTQILADFESIFEGKGVSPLVEGINSMNLLAEACLVVDYLDESIKKQLIDRVISNELAEYKSLFPMNQDNSWLDKVDKRYNWLKKHLVQFETRFGTVFPLTWEISERIAISFCNHTANELSNVMKLRKEEINVQNLLFAVSKTTSFEHLLSQKFPSTTLLENGQKNSRVRGNPFHGLISSCFEPYLSTFVTAQDKNISSLIDSFVDDLAAKKDVTAPTTAEVFPSSGILFTQYKNCLIQCVALSTGQPLLLLSQCFVKNLRDYNFRVLQSSLPKVTSASTLNVITSSVKSSASNLTSNSSPSSGIAIASSAFQSFLKSDDEPGFSPENIIKICSVILTANYCLETSQQLEKKIVEKIDDQLKKRVDMSKEIDLFNQLINQSIDLFLANIDILVDPQFTSMVKTNWSVVDTPTKPSAFIVDMVSKLQSNFQLIRENLNEARKYFTHLCLKFSELIGTKYINHLFRCKSLSRGAAEQLLLDTQTLKKCLIDLPTFGSLIKSAPASYTKVITKGMTKAEMILKVILIPHTPSIDSFIDNYYQLIPEGDDDQMDQFMKILEMKGIKRSECNIILEMFRAKVIERNQNSALSVEKNTNNFKSSLDDSKS